MGGNVGDSKRQFQSTLPQRERQPEMERFRWRANFNPRSRKGSDQPMRIIWTRCINFNPRSRKGSDLRIKSIISLDIFQSTLPQRERRNPLAGIVYCSKISIHAPAKGATDRCRYCFGTFKISIHAPAKGATGCFYGTIPEFRISIHAPAKGATLLFILFHQYQEFQSTLPQRERQRSCTTNTTQTINFNPRSRKGSDSAVYHLPELSSEFQSTLPQRERPFSVIFPLCLKKFQSTLPQRERLNLFL